MPLDRRELRRPHRFPSVLLALVGRPARQRHEAGKVAQHGFAEFVGKKRHLRVRSVDGGAEERADRRSARQPERPRQATAGQKRRERGLRDDQHCERDWTLRFRVEPPFARAHAEVAGLVHEVDGRAPGRGLPDQRPAEAADEERLRLVPGDVGGGPPDPFEPRFDIEQSKAAGDLPARLGAEGARVRNLARREAVRPPGEAVAPGSYSVSRRQVVRREMDSHGHPLRAAGARGQAPVYRDLHRQSEP